MCTPFLQLVGTWTNAAPAGLCSRNRIMQSLLFNKNGSEWCFRFGLFSKRIFIRLENLESHLSRWYQHPTPAGTGYRAFLSRLHRVKAANFSSPPAYPLPSGTRRGTAFASWNSHLPSTTCTKYKKWDPFKSSTEFSICTFITYLSMNFKYLLVLLVLPLMRHHNLNLFTVLLYNN